MNGSSSNESETNDEFPILRIKNVEEINHVSSGSSEVQKRKWLHQSKGEDILSKRSKKEQFSLPIKKNIDDNQPSCSTLNNNKNLSNNSTTEQQNINIPKEEQFPLPIKEEIEDNQPSCSTTNNNSTTEQQNINIPKEEQFPLPIKEEIEDNQPSCSTTNNNKNVNNNSTIEQQNYNIPDSGTLVLNNNSETPDSITGTTIKKYPDDNDDSDNENMQLPRPIIKSEIKEESDEEDNNTLNTNRNHNKPLAVAVKLEATSSSDRESCKFGIKCYRRNPTHRQEQAHPGDDDYRRPNYPLPPLGTPNCPYGDQCYRRNPRHFQDYAHPPSTDFHKNWDNHKRKLRERKGIQYNLNNTNGEDSDTNNSLSDFINDSDESEYVPENNTEELENDTEEL